LGTEENVKRLLIAAGIFLGSILLLSLPGLFQIYRALAGPDITFGVYFTLGPPAAILRGILALVLLAMLSYWLSGKLVKARG